MRLQTLVLGLVLAASGAAFAHEGDRDVTVIRDRDDNTATRIVRRHDFDRDDRIRHVVVVHPRHHRRVVRKVVIVHPAQHVRHAVNRTVVVHRYG